MKRIFKNKFIACIIAAVVALLAAVFAVFYLNKNNDTVKAEAEEATAVTPYICYDYDATTTTLTLSASDTVPALNNCFAGTTKFTFKNVPWYSYRRNITTVDIQTPITPNYMDCWFNECSSLTEIKNFSNIDTSLLMGINQTFAYSSISELDLSGWDVSNLTDVFFAFYHCDKLESLNLSGWQLTGAKNFRFLFGECYKLKMLNLSGFSATGIENMDSTFFGCAFESVDLSGFDTSQVTNMYQLFIQNPNLKSVDMSGWNFSSVANFNNAFYECRNLTEIKLPDGFGLPECSSLSCAFYECNSLKKLDLSGFSGTAITNSIYGCSSLEEIKLSDDIVTQINANNNRGFLFIHFTTWYDMAGNEYTTSKPMTKGGTYYTEMPVCEHVWEKNDEKSTAATCTAGGTDFFDCSKCGETKTEPTAATGHTYGGWVDKIAATCTADKKQEKTCSKCGDKQEQTVAGTKLGHLYGAPEWDWSADYSSATAKFTCTRSGCTDTRNLPATVTSSTTAATCMAEGKTTYTATIAVTGAEFPQTSYTSDPQEVPIDKLNHIAATTWSKDATEHWHACTRGCDTKLDETVHALTIWKVDTPATVTSTGVGHYECVCGQRGTDVEIEKVNCEHSNKTHVAAVAATCKEAGNPEYWTCNDCGKNVGGDNLEISTIVTPVNPDNHVAYGAWGTETAATCTDKGSEKRICADCGHEETRETDIDPSAHNFESHEGKEPTCTEAGWGEYVTCSRCDYSTKTEIPALDHNWAEEWSKDETNHWHECTRCDEINEETAHTYDWVITKEPTEEETGEKEERCTVCEYANGNVETIAKLVVDDNGNVSDLPVLPSDQNYDLEIGVKESDALYVFNDKSISKGFKVELFIVGEDGESTPFDEERTVTLMLHIPDGMEEFKLYKRIGNILELVATDEYEVIGNTVSIRTTLPNEFVFNAPAPAEPKAGIPWWVWLIVGLVGVAIVGVIIVIIVVAKKKNGGDGGTTVVQGTNYDDAELKAQLAKQDKKLDELKEIVDGGFNDFVDE